MSCRATATPRFKKVADALAEQITSGSEVGAAIAIDIDGAIEKIFDVQCDGPDVLLLNPFRPRLRSAIARIDSVQASSDPSAPSVTSIWSTRLSADHAP
jgi:hypothetical protein